MTDLPNIGENDDCVMDDVYEYEYEYGYEEEEEKRKCEICFEKVTNNDYVDHLLTSHDLDEIRLKVKDPKAAFEFGCDVSTKTIAKQQFDYNFIQCKLCENLLFNYVDLKKNHMQNFHLAGKYQDIFSLFDYPFCFVTKSELYLCEQCGIYLENNHSIIDFHNNTIHYNINNNIIQEIYCTICKIEIDDPDHVHHTFISFSKNTELSDFYIEENKKFVKQKQVTLEKFKLLDGDKKKTKKYIGLWIDPSSITVKELRYQYSLLENSRILVNDSIKENFRDIMSKEKLAYAPLFIPSITTKPNANLLKRIQKEYEIFKNEAPCEFENSFFLRVNSENLQYSRLIIVGSRGTPYEHGLFEFDVFVPDDYPNKPPKVTLLTTGSSQIRFNPNLYNNGYVCLSLLGTWRGHATENWNPSQSNLLQVFLSIQAIVMNSDIASNEPCYETLLSNHDGVYMNEAYSNIVRAGNLKFALIDKLKNPSAGFETMIEKYFNLKGQEIINDIQRWSQRANHTCCLYEGVVAQNMNWYFSESGEKSFENTISTNLEIFKFELQKRSLI